jgi:hypothetical protein
MYNNKLPALVFMLLLASSQTLFAQTDADSDTAVKKNKSLVLFIGGGISSYTSPVKHPIDQPVNVNRVHPATTIRVMWYPQYRLSLGLESGYTTFYSYEINDAAGKGKMTLTAIPILITWSMSVVKRLHIYAGFGTYFLTTHLDYKGKVNSKNLSLGSNIALAYQQPVSKNLRIALEAKWMNAYVTKNSALSLQLQLAWKFLEWPGR